MACLLENWRTITGGTAMAKLPGELKEVQLVWHGLSGELKQGITYFSGFSLLHGGDRRRGGSLDFTSSVLPTPG
jgi:hypothetical protein